MTDLLSTNEWIPMLIIAAAVIGSIIYAWET